MAQVHHDLRTLGLDRVRAQEDDPQLVNAAHAILTDDSLERSFIYSGFCLLALPYRQVTRKDPASGAVLPAKWANTWSDTTLELEPGYLPGRHNEEPLGVPYGNLARMILIYLQTRAVHSTSPRIEIGPSMRAWMQRMQMATSGRHYRMLKEQMLRFTASRMTFSWPAGSGRVGFHRVNLITNGVLAPETLDGDSLQGRLFAAEVELDGDFWRALQRHSVPVEEAAVAQLSGNAMALDIYVWLAYRLHALDRAVKVPWPALHQQFGGSYKNRHHFKERFKRPVQLALACYEDANVDVDPDVGMILHPSRPPIAKRQALVGARR